MESSPLYHRNLADGSSVKGVTCKFCGEYVGLLKSKKTGRWYTCQLLASMNPDSSARNAAPWLPHYPVCKENQARMAQMREDAKRAEDPERKAAIERYAEAVNEMIDLDVDTPEEQEAMRAATQRIKALRDELGEFNRFEQEYYERHFQTLRK